MGQHPDTRRISFPDGLVFCYLPDTTGKKNEEIAHSRKQIIFPAYVKLSLLYLQVFLILFFVNGYTAAAQDDATTKFIDSLKTAAAAEPYDSSAGKVDSAAVNDDGTESDYAEELLPDTAITSNQRKISTDTL